MSYNYVDQTHNKLINESPFVLLPDLVRKFNEVELNLNETDAIILQRIHYLLNQYKKNKDKKYFKNNSYWVKFTFKEWSKKHFKYISQKTIRRHFRKLKKYKLLKSKQSKDNKGNWYKINYVQLQKILGEKNKVNYRYKYLLESYPLFILPTLAKKIGLKESIFLQKIHNITHNLSNEERKENKMIDGYYWYYHSLRNWHKNHFNIWSYKTVERTIKKLTKEKLIKKTNQFNNKKSNKTYWYRVNYEKFNKIIDEINKENKKSPVENSKKKTKHPRTKCRQETKKTKNKKLSTSDNPQHDKERTKCRQDNPRHDKERTKCRQGGGQNVGGGADKMSAPLYKNYNKNYIYENYKSSSSSKLNNLKDNKKKNLKFNSQNIDDDNDKYQISDKLLKIHKETFKNKKTPPINDVKSFIKNKCFDYLGVSEEYIYLAYKVALRQDARSFNYIKKIIFDWVENKNYNIKDIESEFGVSAVKDYKDKEDNNNWYNVNTEKNNEVSIEKAINEVKEEQPSSLQEGVKRVLKKVVLPASYDVWFKDMEIVNSDDVITFSVENEFKMAWIKEHYSIVIADIIRYMIGEKKLRLVVNKDMGDNSKQEDVVYERFENNELVEKENVNFKEEILQNVFKVLKDKVNKKVFAIIKNKVKVSDITNKSIIFSCSSSFAGEYIESKYLDKLEYALHHSGYHKKAKINYD